MDRGNLVMVRGEIWWAELPEPTGSNPGYRRPVLVLQSDAFNKSRIGTVICAAITSNLKLAEAPGNVMLRESDTGLSRPSVVNVSQIVTLNRSFLRECVGSISQRMMKKIESGVRLVLDL
jgi:mRNA interferase MazF